MCTYDRQAVGFRHKYDLRTLRARALSLAARGPSPTRAAARRTAQNVTPPPAPTPSAAPPRGRRPGSSIHSTMPPRCAPTRRPVLLAERAAHRDGRPIFSSSSGPARAPRPTAAHARRRLTAARAQTRRAQRRARSGRPVGGERLSHQGVRVRRHHIPHEPRTMASCLWPSHFESAPSTLAAKNARAASCLGHRRQRRGARLRRRRRGRRAKAACASGALDAQHRHLGDVRDAERGQRIGQRLERAAERRIAAEALLRACPPGCRASRRRPLCRSQSRARTPISRRAP